MAKTKAIDILSLIEQDHRKVEQLFADIEKARDKKLYDCFNQIYQELVLHNRAEELVFYPSLREYEETEGFIEEAEEEHADAEALLEEIKQLEPKDPDFMDKIRELSDALQHHIQEEEQEVFAAVRQVMGEEELNALGEEFQEAKRRSQSDVQASLAR